MNRKGTGQIGNTEKKYQQIEFTTKEPSASHKTRADGSLQVGLVSPSYCRTNLTGVPCLPSAFRKVAK